MPTYIEKHTAVTKDTLNVDHNSRETFQHVKFLNPENVYYGNFTGKTCSFEDVVNGKTYDIILSGGIAVISGDDGSTSIVDSAQVKDVLSQATVNEYSAVPSLSLVSALNDKILSAMSDLDSKTLKLSGGNDVAGASNFDVLSARQLSAEATAAGALDAGSIAAQHLSVSTFSDIYADGMSLSAVLSSGDASVSALAEEMRAADEALERELSSASEALQQSLSSAVSAINETMQLSVSSIEDKLSQTEGHIEQTDANLALSAANLASADGMISADLHSNYYSKGNVDQISSALSAEIASKASEAEQHADQKSYEAEVAANSYTDQQLSGYYNKAETDDRIKTLATDYLTNADGKPFMTVAQLVAATEEHQVYYAGDVQSPARNDYTVVLSASNYEISGVWRYTYQSDEAWNPAGWQPQYVIENVNYAALANKPIINGHELSSGEHQTTGTDYGLVNAGDANKVFVKDPTAAGYEAGKQTDLSVMKIPADDYYKLVADGQTEPNTIYVLSSNYFNAYDEQIKNVADASDLSDAVNLKLLNAAIQSVPLSDYYTSAETSSSTELAGKFAEQELQTSSKADLSALDLHIGSRDNPHGVTAQQISAVQFDGSVFAAGNIAVVTADKNIKDSRKKIADFAVSSDVSVALDSKQDKLTEDQLSAIDDAVAERQTVVTFANGTTSAYTVVGELSQGIVNGWKSEAESDIAVVKIGTLVTSIEESTFFGCSGLTTVTIPDSVTSIGSAAFFGCSGLTTVTIPDSVTSIKSSTFFNCSGLMSVTIPDTVTRIESAAFYDCHNLTSVTIPDGVTSIRESAFSSCSGLMSVTIPDTVTSIESAAFFGCSGLTTVTIPDSVTRIESAAFNRCSRLTSVVIPDSVTSIESYAFSGCSNLTSILVKGKTLAEAESLLSDAQVPSGCQILTWNDASQEWVKAQGYLSSYTIPAEYETYVNTRDQLSADGYATSADVSKVYIKDPSEEQYAAGKQTDLSVIKLDNSEYAQLVADGQTLPNALYVISGDYIDAYGQQIKNLSAATDLSDAVPLHQVQSLVQYSLLSAATESGTSSLTATLADQAINSVQVLDSISSLCLEFPAPVLGKARDFALRAVVGDGTAALPAPSLVLPAANYVNEDGTVPYVAAGTATHAGTTLVYFTEVDSGTFLVKGIQVTPIS